jgi:glucosamine--fructose-6-phosphate aminotransferase (isomerizing)
MCGIVGYIGKDNGINLVLDGLEELEYRGYDSAGIAFINDPKSNVYKEVGEVKNLKKIVQKDKPNSNLIIGHTRWATHGKPSIVNAHPHFNSDRTIYVVHNGIIENYQEIKNRLIDQGYNFISETDSEVIPHLIDYYYSKTNNILESIKLALNDLVGTYALEIISTLTPQKLYLARLGSPLVIGIMKNGYITGSDKNVVLEHTSKATFLNDYDLAEVSLSKLKIINLKDKDSNPPKIELLENEKTGNDLGNFPDYMLKEIHDTPETIKLAVTGRINPKQGNVKLGGLDSVIKELEHIDRIIIVACGTSYYAGLVGEYLIEELANIPVEVVLASEFKYKKEPISRSACVIAISQSGETADTIAALNKVKDYGVLELGIVNSIGSSVARLTDAGVYCHAGTEKSVASTKAFISQVTILTLVALRLKKSPDKISRKILSELQALPQKIKTVLNLENQIKELAKRYKDYSNFLYIGRGYNYPAALEGALKLKEISYIHAEGFAAGEMKHGPLALIDSKFPTFAIATDGPLLEKTISNIEEIKARGGPVLAVATIGNKKLKKLVDDVIYIPKTLEQTSTQLIGVVLQLFAYYMAHELSKNIDKPRNLAKSVTVE